MASSQSAQRATFFTRQAQARRRTALLVVYLMVAVALITATINVAVYHALALAGVAVPAVLLDWFRSPWAGALGLGVVTTIFVGSLIRYVQLRGGGKAVAEMLNARPIKPSTGDPLERRLVNVVEEMSIASGTAVPRLYVLDDEPGINAFVAGYKPTEAVMVVTRGALGKLDRDQLQGVVAHEYSHVLNGDMRLNVRLIAILAGLLAIGNVGRMMLGRVWSRGRGGGWSKTGQSASSAGRRKTGLGNIIAAYITVAATLLVVGYIGTFFGRLIKAAVSRQREFLADASSVQFTRNPNGIAGALWEIRRDASKSLLHSSHAEDVSHMCFGQSLALSSMFATHPPIDIRIERVNPGYKGRRAALQLRKRREEAHGAMPAESSTAPPHAAHDAVLAAAAFAGAGAATATLGLTAREAVASVGRPTPAHMDYAVDLHRGIAPDLLDAAHEADSARHLVYALLVVAARPESRRAAVTLIAHRDSEAAAQAVRRLFAAVRKLGERARLPLIDIAIPALRGLDDEAAAAFLETAQRLVKVDGRVTPFEFVLQVLLRKHLSPDATRADRVRHFTLKSVRSEIRLLLSLLTLVGADTRTAAQAAVDRADAGLGIGPIILADASECTPERVQQVFAELAAVSPLLKRTILDACADCITHDNEIRIAETELLRAVAEALDCPMPPLIAP